MKRNIFVTFATYIIVSITSFICAMPIIGTLYEENAIVKEKFFVIAAVLLFSHFCFTIMMYMLAGYLYLRPIESKARNISSIWWISIILLLSVFAVSIVGISADSGRVIFSSNPFSYVVILGTELLTPSDIYDNQSEKLFNISFYIISVITSLIPSLALWVGLLIKRRKTTARYKV